jgi:hypothetical protein
MARRKSEIERPSEAAPRSAPTMGLKRSTFAPSGSGLLVLLGGSLALAAGCAALGGLDKAENGSGGVPVGGGWGGTPAVAGDLAAVSQAGDPQTGSTGGPPPLCLLPGDPAQRVQLVADVTRGVDSALYARAVLRMGLAPDPSLLRADDFSSFYAWSPGYAGAPQDGEVEYDAAEGLVEARFWIPPSGQHVARSFVVLLDESLSMQPRFALERDVVKAVAGHLTDPSDTLVVLGWSSATKLRFDSRTDAPAALDAALDAAFEKPGASSSLSSALDAALTVARGLGAERHVLLLTDGGSSPLEVSDYSLRMSTEGIRLDAALLALSSELRDSKAPARAGRYNQELLTSLTLGDGARVLVTDGPGGDVDAIFVRRFEALFGVGLDAAVATVDLPSFLRYASTPSGIATGKLLQRSVGLGRALTFHAHVVDQAPNLEPSCWTLPIPASLGNKVVTGPVHGDPTPFGLVRAATRRFVEALRTPSPTSRAAAESAIALAQTATCSAGAASADLCASANELHDLLAAYPAQ